MTERPYEFVTTAEGPVLRRRPASLGAGTPTLNRDRVDLPPERALRRAGQPRRRRRPSTAGPPRLCPVPAAAERPGPERVLPKLHDRNEVLFYRLLASTLSEMLPIVYTPTVGKAIENYSHEYRRPRGIYLSVDRPELIEASLRSRRAGRRRGRPDRGHRRRGHPRHRRLGRGRHRHRRRQAGRLHRGGRHRPEPGPPGDARRRHGQPEPARRPPVHRQPASAGAGDEYDAFIDAFVTAVRKLFPDALLHWEDIGVSNARRILERYPDRCCTFNDDMQGTGAVNLAAVLAAVRASRDAAARPAGRHLRRRHGRRRDRRPAARRHGRRGTVPRGGHPAVLVPGPTGADRPTTADRLRDAARPTPGRRPRSPAGPTGAGQAPRWPRSSARCTRRC